jgi:hypothetical protein
VDRNAGVQEVRPECGVGAIHSPVLVESPGHDDPRRLLS